MTITEQNAILNESLENLNLAKTKISDLVDQNHKNMLKLQAAIDLVFNYSDIFLKTTPGKAFLSEFVKIMKS